MEGCEAHLPNINFIRFTHIFLINHKLQSNEILNVCS
jgi:hypothetical protein